MPLQHLDCRRCLQHLRSPSLPWAHNPVFTSCMLCALNATCRQEERQEADDARSRLEAQAAARRKQRQQLLLAQQKDDIAAAQARYGPPRASDGATEQPLCWHYENEAAAVPQHEYGCLRRVCSRGV